MGSSNRASCRKCRLRELVENVLHCTIVRLIGPQWRNSILYPTGSTLSGAACGAALKLVVTQFSPLPCAAFARRCDMLRPEALC